MTERSHRRMPPILLLLIAGAALCVCLFRLWWAPEAFFRSYLPACLFWVGLPLGSLALLMIHRLTGGGWGVFIRPVLETGAGTLPVNAVLFLPLPFGLAHLYAWARPDWMALNIPGGQATYLQAGFFLIREGTVFMLWLGLASALELWRNRSAEANLNRRSALGLIVYGLTVTVFGIDWIMSLEPRWTSTNFGFLSAVNPMVAALAFAVMAKCLLARTGRDTVGNSASLFQDLGGLLLAFVLLWSYLAFQEYLTIWSENLPDKTIWYVQRLNAAGWRWWTWVMAAVYGALPFALLLSRTLKRNPRRLIWAAGLVLAGNALDTYWLVLPSFYRTPEELSPLDALPFIAVGGFWLSAFLWALPRALAESESEKMPHG
ncbi:hypothetical protein [Methylocaldum sp.]|uniref:hypothetical protein n=1 Tax=Methylocaldum sp. TaxID=1969727 RepID=UPI002D4FE40C|nr:hypothetical protein [Methylocaldum sp.]HYE34582.1 hypothetical protein [Methylocaldum sp.]